MNDILLWIYFLPFVRAFFLDDQLVRLSGNRVSGWFQNHNWRAIISVFIVTGQIKTDSSSVAFVHFTFVKSFARNFFPV